MNTLHLSAVALTAIAVGVHPWWVHASRRNRSRGDGSPWVGIALTVVMLIAMVDTVSLGVLAPPLWSGVLLIGALVLAAVSSPRRPGRRAECPPVCVPVSDGLGLVAMAALLPLMHGAGAGEAGHSGHGVGVGVLVLVVLMIAGGHVAASVAALIRDVPRGRAHHVLMGGATLAMAVAAVA